MQHTATYSPDDNKLRLYPAHRLDADDYAKVKAAGFRWAPRQELFVCPAWSPWAEDLLLEMCGEIGDEDKSLVERAEERAERFEEYSDNRRRDADRAHDAVKAISDNTPLGQPILVGHHSERHARRDAEKIQNGMRKAVRMWETSKYWKQRAAGALRNAKYKELPAVRYRRIKGIEADLRKAEKEKAKALACLRAWEKCETLAHARLVAGRTEAGWMPCVKHPTLDQYLHPSDVLPFEDRSDYAREQYPTWTLDQVKDRAREHYPKCAARCDRWIGHYNNRLDYERAMLGEAGGIEASKHDLQLGGRVRAYGLWLTITKLNKKAGEVVSVSTNNTRWPRVVSVEEIRDYEAPAPGQAEKVKAATKLPPLCNYAGEGFQHVTQAEWDREHKDYKGTEVLEGPTRHRVRRMRLKPSYRYGPVFIKDAKTVLPSVDEAAKPEALPAVTTAIEDMGRRVVADQEKRGDFEAMKDSLREGVKVVSAPQLFPTPMELADRVVTLADIHRGHRVLEPSAGTGNLLRPIRGIAAEVVAVEVNLGLAERLRREYPGEDVRCSDFLQCNGDLGTFDRIVMNPPFENASDIKHIEHARNMLKPGGRLVAICANGPRQREKLQPIASEWIDLEPGAFKASGTNVNAAIVVIDA